MKLEGRERLAAIVKRVRGNASLSAFGRRLGVSYAAVSKWENGESVPDTENLAKIAAISGHTLEQLQEILEGNAPPKPRQVDRLISEISLLPKDELMLLGRAIWERLDEVSA